jgi:hypothetical protein
MAVSRLRFKSSGTGTKYIDLAKALSLQERRLHRQKQIYTVYGGYYVDSNGSRIDLNVAPLTWVTKLAVNRAFKMWKKMTARTLQDSSATSKSRYRDFKVFLNQYMSNDPLNPKDSGDNQIQANAAEWDYSTLTSEDPDGAGGGPADQFDLHIVGPSKAGAGGPDSWERVGMLQSWFDSRPAPEATQPNDIPDVTDPLMNLFDSSDVMDDRMVVINQEGDGPPYDEITAFGNAASAAADHNLQRVSTAFTTSVNPVVSIHGFQALCGLIQLEFSGSDPGDYELVLDVETDGESF